MDTRYLHQCINQSKACLSPVMQAYAISKVKEIFPNFGTDPRDKIECYYPGTLRVVIKSPFDIWEVPPEHLACSEKSISFYIVKRFYCPQYNNAEITVTMSENISLSEDDINTLKLLGKIKEEYVPASINTYISCDRDF